MSTRALILREKRFLYCMGNTKDLSFSIKALLNKSWTLKMKDYLVPSLLSSMTKLIILIVKVYAEVTKT